MKKELICLLLFFTPVIMLAKLIEVDKLGYKIDETNHTAVVVELRDMFIESVVIPEIISYKDEDYVVNAIGDLAFNCKSYMKSITIPNSIKTIDREAFRGCTGLTSIELPNSITTIELWTFQECTNLSTIKIPNSVKTIRGGAFSACKSLTSITIPESVVSIEDNVFEKCI